MARPALAWICELSAALICLFAGGGCSSSLGTIVQGPFESSSGALTLWVMNETISRGINVVELCVTKASTEDPVDDLEMEMVPYMPAMGHGSSGPSSSVALGAGCYEFSGIVLNMAGTWELRTLIRGAYEDAAVPRFYLR